MARSGAQSWPAYIYDPMHLEDQLLKQLKYKHSSPDELIAFWYGTQKQFSIVQTKHVELFNPKMHTASRPKRLQAAIELAKQDYGQNASDRCSFNHEAKPETPRFELGARVVVQVRGATAQACS